MAAVHRAGARSLRLPPYNPEYNPIEEMWSKVKERLRRLAARTTPDLYAAIPSQLSAPPMMAQVVRTRMSVNA